MAPIAGNALGVRLATADLPSKALNKKDIDPLLRFGAFGSD